MREDWFEEECLKQLPWIREKGKEIGQEREREIEGKQAGREGDVDRSTGTEKGLAKRPCRVLYLFSGASRKGSFGEELRKKAGRLQLPLVVTEMDTLNAKRKHNFLRPQVREQVLRTISSGEVDAIVASPPCSTFSRARWANRQGPKPLRSARFPRGFARLKAKDRQKTEEANTLVDFAVEALTEIVKRGGLALLEHPEDLGKRTEGGEPGSVWRWGSVEALAKLPGVTWGALFQRDWGAPYSKPTRLLGNLPILTNILFEGPPCFADGWYKGPLPSQQTPRRN